MDTKSIREILNDFDNGCYKRLNKQQVDVLKKKYNIYTNFNYYIDYNLYIYINKESFARLEYYLGLEYERENILLKIEDGEIIVCYDCKSERIEELINLLQEHE